MNFLLLLNKKIVLITSLLFFLLICIFFIFKLYFPNEKNLVNKEIEISNVDITEPKFAINSPSQKIFVTAKEGNFVDKNKIMLKKNVTFKSNEFSIISDNVIFDRKEQTASSQDQSIFKTKNTTISADGFDIYDKGNKIKFYGKTIVILK